MDMNIYPSKSKLIGFQKNFKVIRILTGLSIAELANIMDVTRVQIWNIETEKVKLSTVEYYAYFALFLSRCYAISKGAEWFSI